MAMQCCSACMQRGGNHAAESTAKRKTRDTNKTSQRDRMACGTKQAGGGGTGRSKRADEGPRVVQKKS